MRVEPGRFLDIICEEVAAIPAGIPQPRPTAPMKTSPRLIRVPALLAAGGACLFVMACSGSSTDETDEMREAPPSAAETAPEVTPPAASEPAKGPTAAPENAGTAPAKAPAQEEATMAETAEPKPAPAPAMTPPTVGGVGQGGPADAAGLAANRAEAVQNELLERAESLVSQYSIELATLKEQVGSLKSVIDQHKDMLPAGVTEKYAELEALLPRLTGMVDSLRNYQTADLTKLVPQLQEDFAKARALYGEIKGLLPGAAG